MSQLSRPSNGVVKSAGVTDAIAWAKSVSNLRDFPAAILLWACRSRPGERRSFVQRCVGRLGKQIRVRPHRLKGFELSIDPRDQGALTIYEEFFVEGAYDLEAIPFLPQVVIDCGAFEGYFTLLARAHFPSADLIAFEPNPYHFQKTVTHLERNQITADPRQLAVSNHVGTSPFANWGIGGRVLEEASSHDCFQVSIFNLIELIRSLGQKRLLLKLDVEGEEQRIIPDLVSLLPPCVALFFEWHQGEETLKPTEDLLSAEGFLVRRLRTHGSGMFVDALAVRN